MTIERRKFSEKLGEEVGGVDKLRLEIEKVIGDDYKIVWAKPGKGDLAFTVFEVAKKVGKKPNELANALVNQIESNLPHGIVGATCEGGFVNLELDWSRFGAETMQDVMERGGSYGAENVGMGRVMVIDFSSPNIAKDFTFGHIRSTVIGDALARLNEFMGYEVVRDNHIGDWGTQFGYLLWAIDTMGNMEVIGNDPIAQLQKLYVEANKLAKTDEAIAQAARDWFAKLERGDQQARDIWQKCVDWSMSEFDKLYRYLGIEFDMTRGESYYEPMMKNAEERVIKAGLIVEKEGALVVDLGDADNGGLGQPVFRKKDGASVYLTRDVTTAIDRFEGEKADGIVYVVGEDQKQYFRQLFEIMRRMGFEGKLDHIYFGMVVLPDGKMSTREGRVIYLKDVIAALELKIRELLVKYDAQGEGLGEVARRLTVGALRWNDLMSDPRRKIVFDMEKMTSLDGATGPYVQYTAVRMRSLLEKVNIQGELSEKWTYDDEEKMLIRTMARFKEVLVSATKELSPTIVAGYVYELASLLNSYYHTHHVLGADNEVDKTRRASVIACGEQVLENGLYLLGIEVPDWM